MDDIINIFLYAILIEEVERIMKKNDPINQIFNMMYTIPIVAITNYAISAMKISINLADVYDKLATIDSKVIDINNEVLDVKSEVEYIKQKLDDLYEFVTT